jgi:large subunit ribosomal protein L5
MAKDKVPKKEKEVKPAPVQQAQKEELGSAPRFYETYKKEIRQSLKEKLQFKSISQVPKLEKISINVGVGEASQDAKLVEVVIKDLEAIVGQKPVVTRAKKAISNFKLREGVPVGVRVTLRSKKMYEFFDRFINIALPRVRDFRGLSDKSFDGRGNYTVGVKEQIIFPEIDVDKIAKIFGMDITFVTTAKTDQHAYELFKSFGMPFTKPQ